MTDRGVTTSAAAPGLAFGHHDVAAAWEAAQSRARHRRRLGMVVPVSFLTGAALMFLDVIPSFPGGSGALVFLMVFFAQRQVQWQRDDLLRELTARGAPPALLEVTRAFFGEPAVRRPGDLDQYLRVLQAGGVDPALLGPGLRAALPPATD